MQIDLYPAGRRSNTRTLKAVSRRAAASFVKHTGVFYKDFHCAFG